VFTKLGASSGQRRRGWEVELLACVVYL